MNGHEGKAPTIVVLISGMLHILNEVINEKADLVHSVVAIILALATLLAIYRLNTNNNRFRRNNNDGKHNNGH